jgi:carbon monoxide dehydrogenase subunit G
MMRLDGQQSFSIPVDVFWTKLTDLDFVVSAIPDVVRVKSMSTDRAEIVLRPKLAFIQADLELTIEQKPGDPNRSCEWLLKTKAIGSTSQVRTAMELEPTQRGTTMHWSATVEELGGLLKMVPSGLIEAAARRVITDVLTGIEDKMEDTIC